MNEFGIEVNDELAQLLLFLKKPLRDAVKDCGLHDSTDLINAEVRFITSKHTVERLLHYIHRIDCANELKSGRGIGE